MRPLIVSVIASVAYAAATPPDQALLDWVTGSGGIAHLVLGRSCPSCLRGALASRSFEAGEVVAQVPANSSIALGQGSTAEAALRLLQRLDRDAAFAAAFQPYLAALPGPDEVLSPETLSEAAIEELQTPELVRRSRAELIVRSPSATFEAHLLRLPHAHVLRPRRREWCGSGWRPCKRHTCSWGLVAAWLPRWIACGTWRRW